MMVQRLLTYMYCVRLTEQLANAPPSPPRPPSKLTSWQQYEQHWPNEGHTTGRPVRWQRG
jgi:hypothetical protein